MAVTLRIGVNALYLIPGGVGGTEIYLRNLLAALAQIDPANQYFVFLDRDAAEAEPPVTPGAENFHTVRCPLRSVHRPLRLVWEQLGLPLQAARRGIDVLLSPGFTSPLICPCPKVTAIHDLQHKRHPENFGWLELEAWRATVWISARFSRRVITATESARQDILEVYGLKPSLVQLVRHGVEPALFGLHENPAYHRGLLQKAGVGDWPYLLSVSTVHPHKNWERWLEAYGMLAEQGRPQHLVIAGLKGNYHDELMRRVAEARLGNRVHVTGWVPRPVLLALYKFADALVYPSIFEGFGIPVIEAMADGLPVACSDIPPLREAAGAAALFFNPNSASQIGGAVARLLDDAQLRMDLAERGRRHAKQFTWTWAAEQTLAVLRQAAGE